MTQRKPSRASAAETLAFAGEVALPTLGKGVLIRRPTVVKAADRLEMDARGVHRLQRLRARHGDRPLRLRLPGPPRIVVLSPSDAMAVLDRSPDPFMPASSEKQAALAHFEPRVALASRGDTRDRRRDFNEDALDSDAPVHPCVAAITAVVDEEIDAVTAPDATEMDWPDFSRAWFRIVRRVVLGDGAREDTELTDQLARLRRRANWAFLAPRRKALKRTFHQRLAGHLQRAEPGSLAARVERFRRPDDAATDQVAHWLFAFDPAGMAVFRALALLTAHPGALDEARRDEAPELPYLRGCLMESLRLWPTTPVILRETSASTELGGCALPAGASVIIHAPFFHRDDESLDIAHSFAPERWKPGQTSGPMAFVPFSAGPGRCPARHLVLMTGALALHRLAQTSWAASDPALDPRQPMPASFDPYGLRFVAAARLR
ncbi:cytochrome P450 [Glycocaulis profundi]|nr:cytochrome P450 [Glycocaulis profundi]